MSDWRPKGIDDAATARPAPASIAGRVVKVEVLLGFTIRVEAAIPSVGAPAGAMSDWRPKGIDDAATARAAPAPVENPLDENADPAADAGRVGETGAFTVDTVRIVPLMPAEGEPLGDTPM